MNGPEFSRVVKVRPQPPASLAIEADAAERTVLARRFEISGIDGLRATVTFARDGETVIAKGRMSAELVQACSVSGEDFETRVDGALDLRFVPATGVHGDTDEELESDGPDEIEYNGETIDLGEAVAQSLALAIDPYAEGPDAEAARRTAGIKSEDAARGPLAEALAKLRPN